MTLGLDPGNYQCIHRSNVHTRHWPPLNLPILPHQHPIRIPRIPFLLRRRNRLLHPTRTPNSDRESRNIPRNNRPRSNSRPASDTHTRKNHHIPTNPAIILDEHGVSELDKFLPREDAGVVACAEDTHVRADLDCRRLPRGWCLKLLGCCC